MTINYSCFLDLARQLAGMPSNAPPEEIRFRTVVSRAYYSCYHELLATLNRLELPIPSDEESDVGKHSRALSKLFDARFEVRPLHKPDAIKAYNNFKTLRKRRVIADYELEEEFCEEDMHDDLKRAEIVFKILKGLQKKNPA